MPAIRQNRVFVMRSLTLDDRDAPDSAPIQPPSKFERPPPAGRTIMAKNTQPTLRVVGGDARTAATQASEPTGSPQLLGNG